MNEIELKLALFHADPARLASQLASIPLLARRKPSRQQLHNIYYDTPEQHLRGAKMALRLRRLGSEDSPVWLQTYKTAGRGDSALSQRGEWEEPVAGDALDWSMLQDTPWSDFDPDGKVFGALGACFVTQFERTRWEVRGRDGSQVEVALDLGHIRVDDKTTPICELELELLSGQPAALFAVAQKIARHLAVLPLASSKSERGYALAQNTVDSPRRAQPPQLSRALTLDEAAPCALREMFCQFTTNLATLRTCDDPEVVHQARVGWRRFKSAVRLFKGVLNRDTRPSWQALQGLLTLLGELRELEVASTDTLPPIQHTYVVGNVRRAGDWQTMMLALNEATADKRKKVRQALQEPALGAALLEITEWLETGSTVSSPDAKGAELQLTLRRWARRRVVRLHHQLKLSRKAPRSISSQHDTRIAAKRLRYAIETLHALLPKRRTQAWYEQAVALQNSLGARRDLARASELVAQMAVDRGVAEFLRGLCVGQGESFNISQITV